MIRFYRAMVYRCGCLVRGEGFCYAGTRSKREVAKELARLEAIAKTEDDPGKVRIRRISKAKYTEWQKEPCLTNLLLATG